MEQVSNRGLCIVCGCAVNEGDPCLQTCRHVFHRECFARIQSVCPLCGVGLSENDHRAIDVVRRARIQERCVSAWEGVKTRLSRPLCTNLLVTQLGLGITILLGGGERRSEQLLETGSFFLGMWPGLLTDALLTGGECTDVTRYSVYITLGVFLWSMPSLLVSNVLAFDSDALSNAQVLPVFGLLMGLICALLERRFLG